MAPRTISIIPTMSGILLALLNIMLTITTMPIGTHGLSIRLVPISSLFPKNLTLEERHYKLFEISKSRALYLQQRPKMMRSTTSSLTNSTSLSRNSTEELAPNTIILQPSIRRSPLGYYMAQVSIGSKSFPTYMAIDTGSVLSWVQCEGCQSCFPLSGTGNYKYTQSQSFQRLPCSHSLCNPKICDQNGHCLYEINYAGSSTQGMVLTDSFTFPTSSRTTTAKYPGLVFGCGLVNVNIPFTKIANNVIAGVMGLGLAEKSILVQLQQQTKRRFSYCLPPLDSPTSLRFGDDANIRGRGVQETPLVRGNKKYYVLEVLGLSIDRTFLNINPDVFRLKQNSGGFLVDSGSPYTCIIQSVCKILKEKMVQYFGEHYGLRPLQQPRWIFELCYDMTTVRKGFVLPSVTFHFRGANLVMKPDAVFQSFADNVKCLAIFCINEQGPTILGAFQQTNHRFLFDTDRSILAFVPEKCA